MSCAKLIGLILIQLLGCTILIHALQIQILRIDVELKPDKIWDVSKLKVVRVKPGENGFDGTLGLLQTLDDSSTVEVKVFQSSTGNGQYTLTPFRLPEAGFCEFMNTNYKKHIMDSIMKSSDFPVIGDEYYCPMKKGNYNFNKFIWDPTSVAALAKPGFYKFQISTKMASGDQSSILVFLKATMY